MSVFNASGANNQQGNSINDLNNNAPKSYNHFSNSYSAMLTGRFGEITPFFVMDTPPDANIQLSCPHVLDTYTLSAPIRNTINLRKSYYSVSLASLYHRTFSKFYQLPDKGDDVPVDVYIGFDQLDLANWLKTFSYVNSSTNFSDKIKYDFRYLALFSLFLGNGSLLNLLREPLSRYFFGHKEFDSDFDKYFLDLSQSIDSQRSTVVFTFKSLYKSDIRFVAGEGGAPTLSTLRAAFYYYRANPQDFSVVVTSGDVSYPLKVDFDPTNYINESPTLQSFPINLHRPLAYQIICAQYYSNENIDFIYSEELYRNNTDSLFAKLVTSNPSPSFKYNGTKVYYDIYSKHWNDLVFKISTISDALIGYWSNLLNFNSSLSTSDYFTGGRTRPLAQADITITDTGDGVTAIDVAKKLSLARFAHAVNKTSSQLYSYLKGIFGVNLSLDDKFPRWLADSVHNVKNPAVTSTAGSKSEYNRQGQGAVTSNFADASDSNQYFFHCELPSVIIGLVTFEFANFYDNAIDRHCLHIDRMDMFQPYLQTIGDQSVGAVEMGSNAANTYDDVFCWIVRNGEYKERFSTLHGGFVEHLRPYRLMPITTHSSKVIDSNFIRRHNEDFDHLFTSLSGSSLSHYFHFQLVITADCQCNYNMIRKPQIL